MERKEADPAASESAERRGWENLAAGDDAMEDDLTEERQITPAQREDLAHTLAPDPE